MSEATIARKTRPRLLSWWATLLFFALMFPMERALSLGWFGPDNRSLKELGLVMACALSAYFLDAWWRRRRAVTKALAREGLLTK